MKKNSKLKEKATRMPDISQQEIETMLKKYLQDVGKLNMEAARAQRFLLCLNDLFGKTNACFIEEYLQGIEKYVKAKKKALHISGRIDTLYGNLIIEFESDLRKKLPEAIDQLKKYVFCLWSEEENGRSYIAIATDGIKFIVYFPKIQIPISELTDYKAVELEEIEEVNFSSIDPYDIYFWLD